MKTDDREVNAHSIVLNVTKFHSGLNITRPNTMDLLNFFTVLNRNISETNLYLNCGRMTILCFHRSLVMNYSNFKET